MKKIIIQDAVGNKHLVDVDSIIKRNAIYGIYLKNNSFLMVKDSKSAKWEFPGGGLENTENELDALKREFLEETGLTVVDTKLSTPLFSIDELFFDLNCNEAWITCRKFFILNKVKGVLKTNGNGDDTTEACFLNKENFNYPTSKTTKNVFRKMVDF